MNSLIGESLSFPKQYITIEDLIHSSPHIKFYKARQSEKLYLLKQFKSPEMLDLYTREVIGLKSVNLHGKILQIIDHKDFQDYSVILFEFPARFTLTSVMKEDQNLSDSQIATLLRDVLVALFHIQQKKLAHLNISSESIFVTYDYKFKLGEFSNVCNEFDIKVAMDRVPQELRPPELLEVNENALFGSAVDMWAVGCLMYKVIYKENPFGWNLEHQLRGKTKKSGLVVADYWRLILNRLLDPNPMSRAKVQEVILLIQESYMPKVSFPENTDYIKPINSFGFSTKSWIKAATEKNDSLPDQTCISKLIGKAWNKAFKIPKVFQELSERPLTNEYVIIKSLLVVFRYFCLGPKCVFDIEMGGLRFLSEVEKNWKFSLKPKQNSVSEEFKTLIVSLLEMIKSKMSFHSQTKTIGDWSELSSIEKSSFDLIFTYWELSIRALSSLLATPDQLSSIKSYFSAIIIEEQERIMMDLFDLSKTISIPLKYEELKTETLNLIETLKVCYPTSSLIKLFTQTSVSSSSPSSTERSESSKNNTFVEEKPTNNGKRASLLLTSGLLWMIDPAEVKKEKEIGAGSSCSVFRGTYRHTPVAIKVLKAGSKSSMKEFEREVEAMLQLKHPNLILFMGATMGKEMSIVTEFCFGDTVFSLLHERSKVQISAEQQLRIVKDTAKGMAYLHASGLIHRDLKSLNLLLLEPVNSPTDRIHVKITDFGITVTFDQERVMTGQMGTCHWMAPEVLNNEGYDLSADVYSFAVVVWEIFARETPYKNINPAMIPYRVLNLGERPDITKIKHPDIQNLIVRCWTRNKENRPSFVEIIQMLDEIKLE